MAIKIEQIEPADDLYFCVEEFLDGEPKRKSKIILTEDAEEKVKQHHQRAYKIRAVPKDSKYKIGERVLIAPNYIMNPNPVKINDIVYLVIGGNYILGKIKE